MLLDYQLTDMDGLTFLKRLRAASDDTSCAVVMLTGTGNESIAVRALKEGMQDYLIKDTLTSHGLQHAVGQAIHKVELERELERQRAALSASYEAERRARAEAEAANRRMDEFLLMATHELKTSLTTLQANLQIIERRLKRLLPPVADTSAEALAMLTEYVDRNLRQVRRLIRLVNDLVDAARIQAGKLEMRMARCDLAALLGEVVAELRVAPPARPITLHLPNVPETVPVLADADRIGQVIANYVTNALKYSPKESTVEVELRVEDNTATVFVRDEGRGIPSENLDSIWERGYRVLGAEVMSESMGLGLGLGLYISREIVEHHSGTVGVESTPEQGSTFWFTLPLAE